MPEYGKWRRDTEVAVERIFGSASRHINDLRAVFMATSATAVNSPADSDSVYAHGLKRAGAVLRSMIDEVKESGIQYHYQE